MSQHVGFVEGTVEAVNDRGIRINGEWLNFSKFKVVAAPKLGERVQVGVDPKGFIVDVTTLDANTNSSPDRDRRLAVLAVAAGFLGRLAASREDVRSDHVLLLADKWLAWIEES